MNIPIGLKFIYMQNGEKEFRLSKKAKVQAKEESKSHVIITRMYGINLRLSPLGKVCLCYLDSYFLTR